MCHCSHGVCWEMELEQSVNELEEVVHAFGLLVQALARLESLSRRTSPNSQLHYVVCLEAKSGFAAIPLVSMLVIQSVRGAAT